jgi:AraC-like DNA-binding protein
MNTANDRFTLGSGWRVLLQDAGIDAADALRAAELPAGLLADDDPRLTPEAFFRLWEGLARLDPDPAMPVRLVSHFTAEAFEPSLFAALCSPDFRTAMQRLARFKPLFGPMRLEVGDGPEGFHVRLRYTDGTLVPPPPLALAELAIWLQLGRMGTRQPMDARAARMPRAVPDSPVIRAFFGVAPTSGATIELVVSREEALRPFLTHNEALWRFFEPTLRQRLQDLSREAETRERLRAALLELFPGGEPSIDAASRHLATSRRTLQRRLQAEGTSYRAVLDEVREELARHYLAHSRISHTEIALLLGFADPNSFYRAFHDWTGRTPDTVRREAARAH